MKEKHNFKVSMFVCEIILTFWQICPVRAAERMLFARLLSPGRRSPVTSLYQLSKVHSSQNSRTKAVSIVEGKYARIVVKSTVSDKINWLRNLFSPTQWPHQNIFLLSFTFHLLKLQQSASQVNNIKFYYRKLLPTLSFPPHTIDYCDDCLHSSRLHLQRQSYFMRNRDIETFQTFYFWFFLRGCIIIVLHKKLI